MSNSEIYETTLDNLEYGDVFKFKNRGKRDPRDAEYFELTPEGVIDLNSGIRYSYGCNYHMNTSYYRRVLINPSKKKGKLTNEFYAKKESYKHAWLEFYKVLKDGGAFCDYPTEESLVEYGKCDYSYIVNIKIGKTSKEFSFSKSCMYLGGFRVDFLKDKIYDPEYFEPIIALLRYFIKHDRI